MGPPNPVELMLPFNVRSPSPTVSSCNPPDAFPMLMTLSEVSSLVPTQRMVGLEEGVVIEPAVITALVPMELFCPAIPILERSARPLLPKTKPPPKELFVPISAMKPE